MRTFKSLHRSKIGASVDILFLSSKTSFRSPLLKRIELVTNCIKCVHSLLSGLRMMYIIENICWLSHANPSVFKC